MDANKSGPQHASGRSRPGWKLRLEDRLNLLDPISVLVFRSFGTPDVVHIRGRVIERKGVQKLKEEASIWENVKNTIKRFDSDEIPGALLRAHLEERSWETTTDEEGYFAFEIEPTRALAPGWHKVKIELVDSLGEPERRFVYEDVLVPSSTADFIVVSDLDDTVVRSRANQKLQQLAITFSEGADSRSPFPGVPAFYRALAAGGRDEGENPIFYVSNSGWNLYDLLESFLELNDIPAGPLCLTDLHFFEDASAAVGSERHKRDTLDHLLLSYPDLPFILIGDSGQSDVEHYRSAALANPDRIKAIYIHDVEAGDRDDELERTASELHELGIHFMYSEDTLPVAEHAERNGFISAQGLASVRAELGGN